MKKKQYKHALNDCSSVCDFLIGLLEEQRVKFSQELTTARAKINELETELGHIKMAANNRLGEERKMALDVVEALQEPDLCPCGCGAYADPEPEIETILTWSVEETPVEQPLKNPSGLPGWMYTGTGYDADSDIVVAEPHYRMLAEGEIIQKGDEYNLNGGWQPVWDCSVGQPLFAENVGVYRRPVTPTPTKTTFSDPVRMSHGWMMQSSTTPQEYRMLEVGEVVTEGDESRARKNSESWSKVSYSIGHTILDECVGHYRRPVTTPHIEIRTSVPVFTPDVDMVQTVNIRQFPATHVRDGVPVVGSVWRYKSDNAVIVDCIHGGQITTVCGSRLTFEDLFDFTPVVI